MILITFQTQQTNGVILTQIYVFFFQKFIFVFEV